MVTGPTLAWTPHVNHVDQEGLVLVTDFSDPEICRAIQPYNKTAHH